MPAEEGQPDDQPRVTGQVPPPAPTTGLEQILPGRPPLPHAEEKGAFFVYQRELAPGTRLEQYEIIRVLGSGGFGITYLAKDLFLNRNVVIKENFPSRYSYRDPLTGHIRPNNEHDLENYTWALKSFLSEAQTLAELNNPGIVRILSVFEANGTAYFAMEHITGLSLDYLGEKLHSTGHRYTEDELKGLLTDIGTEELGHLEMVGTIVHQLTRNLTEEQIKEAGFEAYFVDHTTGVFPQFASGYPWSASTMQVTGDTIADLTEDLAAEQKARVTYDNILRLSDDPDVSDVIKFLRAREIVHFQRFGEGLRLAKDRLDEKNVYYVNPSFDK